MTNQAYRSVLRDIMERPTWWFGNYTNEAVGWVVPVTIRDIQMYLYWRRYQLEMRAIDTDNFVELGVIEGAIDEIAKMRIIFF